MSKVIKSSQVNLLKKTFISHTQGESDPQEEQVDLKRDAQREYENIIEIAKKQAKSLVNDAILESSTIKENIVKDAEEHLEEIKKQAYEEAYEKGKEEGFREGKDSGHEEGFKEGFEQGKDEAQSIIEEANKIKRDYLDEREKILKAIEPDTIDLVLSIVEKVLNEKVAEEDTIVKLVLKGLESLNSKDDIRIRVSKEDFDKVNRSKEEILSKVSLIESLKVDMDSNLKKGDCFIESSKGNVDVSVATQIKNVEEELRDLLDSE